MRDAGVECDIPDSRASLEGVITASKRADPSTDRAEAPMATSPQADDIMREAA